MPSRAIGTVALLTLTLTGCAAAAPPTTGADHAPATTAHVHAIVPAPDGDGFLLGTHEGIYTASATGEVGARVGGDDFDAMGLTVVGGDLLASGHPGRNTPSELGEKNLGIIRSSDGGETWDPVAFTGEKDFHALTAGPDGTLYGQDASSNVLMFSTDAGITWTPTGGELLTFGLAVEASERVIAVTPDGPHVSTDRGATFTPMANTPRLIVIAASPNHQRLVGVDNDETLWTSTTGNDWENIGTVHGPPQAITITNDGVVLVVDDSGLSLLPPSRL